MRSPVKITENGVKEETVLMTFSCKLYPASAVVSDRASHNINNKNSALDGR